MDQQPIGKLLFKQWCESKCSEYNRCLKFLEATERYEVETGEARVELADAIKKEFMSGPNGEECLSFPELGLQLSASDKLTNGHKDLFAPCVQAVKACLAHEPFREHAEYVLPSIPAVEVAGGAARHVQDVPHVPRVGQGWLWRGVRLSGNYHHPLLFPVRKLLFFSFTIGGCK